MSRALRPAPWRLVEEAEMLQVFTRAGATSRWLLSLPCGHSVTRSVRYRQGVDVVTGEIEDEPLPPPRKVRCGSCPTVPGGEPRHAG